MFWTPERVVCYALGIVWSAGAVVQHTMTVAGVAYEHGDVFTAIMGIGALGMFAIPSIRKTPP